MSLKVVVIGAGGLVGARLADALVKLRRFNTSPTEDLPLDQIMLMDAKDPTSRQSKEVLADPRVKIVEADLCDARAMARLIDTDGGKFTAVTTIHLAAVLSGYAEENFDLGMKVNLHGSLGVMEVVRDLSARLGKPQIYVYTSTDYVTAFIPQNKVAPTNEESFRLCPVSYGCQKACVEILLSDYTRKGFFDGRVARLSAVIGRPGFSNSISYPYTGIFTQPLEGKDYGCPLPMDVPYPCSSIQVRWGRETGKRAEKRLGATVMRPFSLPLSAIFSLYLTS